MADEADTTLADGTPAVSSMTPSPWSFPCAVITASDKIKTYRRGLPMDFSEAQASLAFLPIVPKKKSFCFFVKAAKISIPF